MRVRSFLLGAFALALMLAVFLLSAKAVMLVLPETWHRVAYIPAFLLAAGIVKCCQLIFRPE